MKQETSSENVTDAHSGRVLVVVKGEFCGDKCFPSLNDYLKEMGTHPQAGGKFKKKYEMIANNAIRRCLKRWKAQGRITLHYRFYEPAKGVKRDHMNVFTMFDKVFQDSLQACGVIPNDSPQYVDGSRITHEFFYTSEMPKVEIEIEEVETPERFC